MISSLEEQVRGHEAEIAALRKQVQEAQESACSSGGKEVFQAEPEAGAGTKAGLELNQLRAMLEQLQEEQMKVTDEANKKIEVANERLRILRRERELVDQEVNCLVD